jgi:hypothetical protein
VQEMKRFIAATLVFFVIFYASSHFLKNKSDIETKILFKIQSGNSKTACLTFDLPHSSWEGRPYVRITSGEKIASIINFIKKHLTSSPLHKQLMGYYLWANNDAYLVSIRIEYGRGQEYITYGLNRANGEFYISTIFPDEVRCVTLTDEEANTLLNSFDSTIDQFKDWQKRDDDFRYKKEFIR